MSEKLRTIRLYGKLGVKFGREHRLAVNSAREAMRALSSLLPGFESYMMKAKDRGMTFAVFIGKENIKQDRLEYPVGDDAIRIAPVIIGSKKAGVLQTILGIILIVIGVFAEGVDGGAFITAGIGLIAGGVVQLLSPQPSKLGTGDSSDNQAGYSFNGSVNTQAQGNPVPLLYGRLIVGSAVISAGIRSKDIYVPRRYNYGDVNGGEFGFSDRWHSRPHPPTQ